MTWQDDPVVAAAVVAFDATAIDAAVTRLSDEIAPAYAGRDPLFLCVLAGALPFTAALTARRPAGLVPTWSGLQAGSGYLFGFGMDLHGRYLNLADIRILPQEEGA